MRFILLVLSITLISCDKTFTDTSDKYNIGDTINHKWVITGKDRAINYYDWQYTYKEIK
jgi:hypothetical protein